MMKYNQNMVVVKDKRKKEGEKMNEKKRGRNRNN
jgi:hypothetical protein